MACRVISTIVCYDSVPIGCTFCISGEGDVYSIGRHPSCYSERFVIPTRIPSLKHITSIRCAEHVVCLDIEGNVFTIGENSFGELGSGLELRYSHELQKVNLPPIKQIACGNYFTVCISDEGELYSFGRNYYGQLGHGNTDDIDCPKRIESLKDVEFVECGAGFVICKTSNNEIYSWGSNEYGQLGIGNTSSEQLLPVKCTDWREDIVDIKCGYYHTLVLTATQEVYYCGRKSSMTNEPLPVFSIEKISSLSEITRIECGKLHSVCIDNYDNLFVFGCNRYAQLGLGDYNDREEVTKHPSLSNIIDISSGGEHTFVKTSSDKVYAFGVNDDQQFGIKTEMDLIFTPIQVFIDNEDVWHTSINKLKTKSARSFVPNEDNNSPLKKQKK